MLLYSWRINDDEVVLLPGGAKSTRLIVAPVLRPQASTALFECVSLSYETVLITARNCN